MKKKFSFAHFMKRAGKPRAEEQSPDEDPKKDAAEGGDGEDDADADAEGDDEDVGDDADGSDDGEGDDDEEEADEDVDKTASVRRRAKAALAAARKEGRQIERQRCAAIFSSEHAAEKTGLACTLAFNTPLSAKAAIGILSKAESGSAGGLGRRMSALKQPKLGNGAGGTGEPDAGASLLARATTRYEKKK